MFIKSMEIKPATEKDSLNIKKFLRENNPEDYILCNRSLA